MGIIPEGMKAIGGVGFECAFENSETLTSVIIPNSVTEIGYYTFADCISLTNIVIPDSVTEIGNSAFKRCTGLTSIVIPDSVTEIRGGTFFGCTGLTSIVIPDSVTEIGDEAFKGCTALKNITIPDSVTKIGNHAFSGCANLTSIVIPSSVTKIGSFAFENCPRLKSIIVSKDNKVYDSRENCNAIIDTEKNALEVGCINTVIPSSVVGISMGAFWGSGLTSIVIPATVSWINRGVFSGSKNLKSIVVEEGNPKYNSQGNCNAIIDRDNWLTEGCATTVIPESVVLIGEEAFKNCTGLTTIVIPKSVREIREYAFRGCTGLTSIVIPASVTKIDKYAFEGSRLTKIVVEEGNPTYDSRNDCNAIIETAENRLMLGFANSTIPDTVIEIGKQAFYERKGLTDIIIPKSVKTIEGDAFWGCTDLKSVSILGPVKKLEETFSRCSALETVTLGVGIKTIKENAFNFCTSLKTIYVPAKKADYYKERLPENLHGLIVEMPVEKKAKKK